MKLFLALLIAAAVAGSTLGWYLSASAYAWPESRFGPFSTQRDLKPEGLDAYFAKVRPTTFPDLEVVGGTTYDFGVMLRGAEGSCEFELRNIGDAELELKVTGSTCKCTVGDLVSNALAPGESTTVKMNWTVKTTGDEFQQSATLRTNDPEQAELQLSVSGRVVDRLDPYPEVWSVGEVSAGEPIELAATIYNRYEHDLEFVSAEWTKQAIRELAEVDVTARSIEPAKSGDAYKARQAFDVKAVISPGLDQGRLDHALRLKLRHPPGSAEEVETVALRLTGRLVGPISLLGGPRLTGHQSGQYVFAMKRVAAGEGRTDKVYVVFRGEHRSATKLKVGEVEPSEVLAATLGEPVEQGDFVRYPLELTIKKDAPVGERLGKNKDDYGIVTIESESQEVAPIRLRVEYSVGGPAADR